MTGRGVVSFISNHSWVSDPSFVVLREHLLDSFDRFWVENMHGNRKISEYSLDGRTSETVFAIPGFSSGIKQGVAISLWVKNGSRRNEDRVLFRDDINEASAVERRAHLLRTLETEDFDTKYTAANPSPGNRYSFKPSKISNDYKSWPSLTELCSAPPMNGLMEKRHGALMDSDKSALEKRMRKYYDPQTDWESLKEIIPQLTVDAARFQARGAREKQLRAQHFDAAMLQRYALRPLENCWAYYSTVRPLWNEPRPSLWKQCWIGNSFLVSRFKAAKDPEGPPFYFVRGLSDDHVLTPDAACFPIQLKIGNRETKTQRMFQEDEEDAIAANLSNDARRYYDRIGITEPDTNFTAASSLWFHALSIGYSPNYLRENLDGVRQDWPRIPLPSSQAVLLASAESGRRIADLLLESPVEGITSAIRPELKFIAVTSREGGGSLKDPDLALTAGWGHSGRDGVTMPGKGAVVEREYLSDERKAILAGARDLKLSEKDIFCCLGDKTYDVYLNRSAYWSNVPARVWDYAIGGSPIAKRLFSGGRFQKTKFATSRKWLVALPLSSFSNRSSTLTTSRSNGISLLGLRNPNRRADESWTVRFRRTARP